MAAFFEHQAEARRNTRWLLAGMAGAVLATGLGLYGLVLAAQLTVMPSRPVFGYEPELWHPRLFAICLFGTASIVLCASAYRMFSLRGGGARVAEMMGGRLVSGQPRNLLERRLLNVVEEMAIASGVPVPQVFVLPLEDGINAFAAGFSIDDAAIAVTWGTLEKLTRAELQGVIAHEFSHVLNGDMRLNTRLMGTVYGIVFIGMCGRALMRLGARTGNMSFRRRSGGGGYFVLLGLGVFLVGWFGELLGKLIKAAVSRQREFLADASAAQFTRDPLCVAGALKKIGGHGLGGSVGAPAAQEASHLFFGDLTHHLFAHSWLATHPPLTERIARLEPSFQGEFTPTPEGVAEPEDPFGLAAGFAAAGPQRAPVADAGAIVQTIGQVGRDALEESRRRLAMLPAALQDAAHHPFSACALVYALWLTGDATGDQELLALIAEEAGSDLRDEAARQSGLIGALSYDERLSLVELAAPALREMSLEQRRWFAATIESLTHADGRTSIFELVVGTMLSDRLLGEADARSRGRVRHRKLSGVRAELELVLSLLAHAGDFDGGAVRAFEAGASRLSGVKLSLLPASDRLLNGLRHALGELRGLRPELAERVVDACAHCVFTDRKVSSEESALLRALCDALGCPLPLFQGV